MNWQALLVLLSGLLLISCQHKADTTITPPIVTPPVDSPEIFVPYTVRYSGSIHNQSVDWNSIFNPSFDTTHMAVVNVQYPDTLHLKFHLAFWDVNRNTSDSLYFFEQEYRYARNSLDTYLDGTHDYNIRFTIRGDSLHVRKYRWAGLDYQTVTFAGRRQ